MVVQVHRAIVRHDHVGRLCDIHSEPGYDQAMRLRMVADANRGWRVHDSIDELGLLDVRACQIPTMELLAGQVVTRFKVSGCFNAHGHGPTSPRAGAAHHEVSPTRLYATGPRQPEQR